MTTEFKTGSTFTNGHVDKMKLKLLPGWEIIQFQ